VDHTEFTSVVEAARSGAEWAWTRLYGELAGPVAGYMRSRGAVETDDLVGEVFLQVARNISTFDGDGRAFRSWVFTIAHHRVIDERRARARRPVDTVEVDESVAATGDAEQEALEDLGTERALSLLGGLTPAQRDVLLLRIIGDLSLHEVARVLGRRPGAVKALQRRGLAALRRKGVSR
jgi:RNA polymerase sigma-70 factor (ECF subfamily)